LVGGIEVRAEEKEISIDSPVARAVLDKSLDDEVTVTLPDNDKITYFITGIRYQ